jgi:hypothetical protein
MKIEFDIFNREFFRTLTFSLKFQKKAQVSIIYILNRFLIANTDSSTATWACNTQLGLPNDEIEILSSGS